MWTAVALLLIIWLAGLLTSYTLSGWIHLVPLLALTIIILSFWFRRKKRYSRY